MLRQNQLQFNLDHAPTDDSLAARYRIPGPLVIEKLGPGNSKSAVGSNSLKESPLKFTKISEDRLSMALRLARHDLKNALTKQQETSPVAPIQQEQRQSRKSRTKRSPTGKHQRTSLKVRERYANENQRSVKTQTPKGKRVNSHGLVLHTKHVGVGESGQTSMSPMRKDAAVSVSPDSQQAVEIKRLRLELKLYMRKIEELSKKASDPKTVVARKSDETKDEDTDEARRQARAAEQASRSARLLYSLQQQVRELQEELDKLGPGKVRHTKKSRALIRLAAAHRGAIRALQSFLHHLPSESTTNGGRAGLQPHYQELALLVRQLSLCCAQLDVDENGVPEGVMNILEQARDFQEALSQQIPTSSQQIPTSSQQIPTSSHQAKPRTKTLVPNRSPRRRLAFEGQGGPRSKKTDINHFRINETPVKDTDNTNTPRKATVDRLRQTVRNNKATPGSPERNEVLRAGLQALLRAAKPHNAAPPKPPPSKKLPSSRIYGGTSKERRHPSQLVKAPPASRRSLILPAKLKSDRERLQRLKAPPRDAHFTQDTVASKMKHRDPLSSLPGEQSTADPPSRDDLTSAVKPAWMPPGSPRSFHKVASPRVDRLTSSEGEEEEAGDDTTTRKRKVVFDLTDKPGGSGSGTGHPDPGLMEREIARQAWLDAAAAKQMATRHTVPQEWLQEAERVITDRLQPLIDKAQSVATEHQRVQTAASQSLPHQLSQRAVQATMDNVDVLSDLILGDVLTDTAAEFLHIEHDQTLEGQARRLQDGPTIEGMMQSLEKMELLEDEIRRRWKRVEYIGEEEEERARPDANHQETKASWMMGTPLDGNLLERSEADVPRIHTSMQYTNVRHDADRQAIPDHGAVGGVERPTGPSGQTDRGVLRRLPQPLAAEEATLTDGREDYAHPAARPTRPSLTDTGVRSLFGDGPEAARDSSHVRTTGRPTDDKVSFPLFIPSDAMHRIKNGRGRFEQHLRSTSHWAYGTFDPWKLVEELADEIVTEIIKDVSLEVSDIMGHCVDELYKAEFEMT